MAVALLCDYLQEAQRVLNEAATAVLILHCNLLYLETMHFVYVRGL